MWTDSTGMMPRSVCETWDGKALGWMTGKEPISDRPTQSNAFKALTSNGVKVIADRSHLPMSRTRKASVVPGARRYFSGYFRQSWKNTRYKVTARATSYRHRGHFACLARWLPRLLHTQALPRHVCINPEILRHGLRITHAWIIVLFHLKPVSWFFYQLLCWQFHGSWYP